MNLVIDYPRSPSERLAGLDLLARTIDLARAELARTLGPYTYWNCILNRMLFDTLQVNADEFLEVVREADRAAAPSAEDFLEDVRESRENPSFVTDQHILSGEKRLPIDKFVVHWIEQHRKLSQAGIAAMNTQFETLEPNTPEERQDFAAQRNATGTTRTDITTYAALLDLQEGRISVDERRAP